MLRNDKTVNILVLAGLASVAVAWFVPRQLATRAADVPGAPKAVTATAAITSTWAAAAPGRVEPIGGEIRISGQAAGRIAEVMVGVNDKVLAGDLLLRLDDTDLDARVLAAEAEASVRRRERDVETVGVNARDRRTAEDAVASAERLWTQNRTEYDRWLRARKVGTAQAGDVIKARETVVTARERLDQARSALRRITNTDNLPAQTRLEAGLAAARADFSLADAALERARIRAPRDATVLQITAIEGESVTPNPEQVLLVLGDISKLRVRAEIEERDVGKVRAGQTAVVRSDAFPGREFEGKVASYAQSLAPGRLSLKGPRKGTEVDVLELLIDLAGTPPLLPGMRVDVFLKPDGEAPKAN